MHTGLRLPAPAKPFILEVVAGNGYAGVLLQTDEDGRERPVACVSTLQACVAENTVEGALQATRYCLRKFREVLLAAPRITVRTSVRGVAALLRGGQHGSRLVSLVAEV